VVRAAVALGFKRFRVTGGEPLVRPGAVEFIRDLIATPGVESVQLDDQRHPAAGTGEAFV